MSPGVDPEVHERAQRNAAGAGMSLAYYLSELIMRDERDETGCPVWARDKDGELPLGNTT